MSGSRLVRGTRSRLFLYLGVVTLVGLAVYVFHGAQLQLDDARKAADKCQQQQESLSAQLQVIFEYKLRLEKSLQQEKTEHRQTREELEARATEEKTRREKESLEATNKHAALQQQYKLLQSQHEDLNEECKKVRVEQLHGLEERSKLESQVQAVQAELEQVQASHKKSLNSLKSQYMKLEVENEQLQKQHTNLVKGTSQTSDRINFLEKQNIQLRRELEKVQKELDSYKLHHPAGGDVKRHAEDEEIKSPEKSPSSPASSASPDMAVNVKNQNVLQEPLGNPDFALEKVRSSTSSSNALPVGDKLPSAKGSSQSMGFHLGNNYFLVPVSQSSSLRPAPAMYVQDAAIAAPPHDVNIEQLQQRLEQILNENEPPRGL